MELRIFIGARRAFRRASHRHRSGPHDRRRPFHRHPVLPSNLSETSMEIAENCHYHGCDRTRVYRGLCVCSYVISVDQRFPKIPKEQALCELEVCLGVLPAASCGLPATPTPATSCSNR